MSLATLFFIHAICSDSASQVTIDTSTIQDSPSQSLKKLSVDSNLFEDDSKSAPTSPEENSCLINTSSSNVTPINFIIGSANTFNVAVTSSKNMRFGTDQKYMYMTALTYYKLTGNKQQNAKETLSIYNIFTNPDRLLMTITTSKTKDFNWVLDCDMKKLSSEETYTLSLAGGKLNLKDSKKNVIAQSK